uniref:Uncharacterized protein n=1 Tax=Mycena chlorophos TaxID=658473 RepID=A0ABQ0LHF9_MYCCL|nr:predicted protein [Mycena chlorophos]
MSDSHRLPTDVESLLDLRGLSLWPSILAAESTYLPSPSEQYKVIDNWALVIGAVSRLATSLRHFLQGNHRTWPARKPVPATCAQRCSSRFYCDRVVKHRLKYDPYTLVSLAQWRQDVVAEICPPGSSQEALQQAMLRDSFRCLISGLHDMHAAAYIDGLMSRARLGIARIFSETGEAQSDREALENSSPKMRLSLTIDWIDALQRMEFWLEPVSDGANTYRIANPASNTIIWTLAHRAPESKHVTFAVDEERQNKPVPQLPSSALLAIQINVAKIQIGKQALIALIGGPGRLSATYSLL